MKKLFLLVVVICLAVTAFESCDKETSFIGGKSQTSARGEICFSCNGFGTCSLCNGSGFYKYSSCDACSGHGQCAICSGSGTFDGTLKPMTVTTQSVPTYNTNNVCSSCGGSGYSNYTCTWCDGDGIDPAYEHTKGSVIHTFAEKDCASCGGVGLKKCTSCYGRGTN